MTTRSRASWSAAALAGSYKVRWWPAGHPGWADSSTTGDLAMGVSGLVAGQEYVVSVAGRGPGGTGPGARQRVTPTAAPAAPDGVAATVHRSGVVVLTWSAVRRATAYEVWRRDLTTDGPWRQVQLVAASSPTRARMPGLRGAHRYALKVRARHQLVPGPYSLTVKVRVPAGS